MTSNGHTAGERWWGVQDVSVKYGKTLALDRVSLRAEPGQVTGLAPPRMARRVPVATLLRHNVTLDPGLEAGVTIVSGTQLPQASGQQMVPVRFSSEQHAQLRQWCSEHGFSMATVIRGLVARFLETQPPGQGQPA